MVKEGRARERFLDITNRTSNNKEVTKNRRNPRGLEVGLYKGNNSLASPSQLLTLWI
jgi:hypothetical protein